MPVPKLAPGATGDMVKALQLALIANGFSVGAAGADGKFGEATLVGLNAFQDDNAQAVQPWCNNACWAALYPPQQG